MFDFYTLWALTLLAIAVFKINQQAKIIRELERVNHELKSDKGFVGLSNNLPKMIEAMDQVRNTNCGNPRCLYGNYESKLKPPTFIQRVKSWIGL